MTARKPSKPSKRRKGRKNPALLTIGNPDGDPIQVDRDKLEKAVAAYEEFHGEAPTEVMELPGPGAVYVMLGELRDVLYEPRKGHRSGAVWEHTFGPGAALVASPDGRDVRIVSLEGEGARLRVDWSRGIVG